MNSSDSLVVHQYLDSLIKTFLSNNGVLDLTNYAFELTNDRKPNFTKWEYIDTIKPTWSELEDLQETENHLKHKIKPRHVSENANCNCNAKIIDLENRVTELEKQISDYNKQVQELITKSNSNSNTSTKTLSALQEVSDKLAKVDTQSKVNIPPMRPKPTYLSKR